MGDECNRDGDGETCSEYRREVVAAMGRCNGKEAATALRANLFPSSQPSR